MQRTHRGQSAEDISVPEFWVLFENGSYWCQNDTSMVWVNTRSAAGCSLIPDNGLAADTSTLEINYMKTFSEYQHWVFLNVKEGASNG